MNLRTASPNHFVAYLCLASSMAIVGAYVGFSKLLVLALPIFLLAWMRFGIAAVAMLPWLRRRAGDAPLAARDRRLIFLESFFGNFLFSICMLFGISLTSALAAGVIMAAIPAMVALLSRVILGERIDARVAVGIAFAVGGIALVSLVRDDTGAAPVSLLGNVLLVGAVTCESLYVVIGKQLAGNVSPRRISALINLWGLVLITPLGLWQAWDFAFAQVALETWGLLLVYAIAASMITVWLWMTGLRHVPASSAGIFTVLLPVSAATTGVLLLGEIVTGPQLGAFALALTGIVLATWRRNASAVTV